VRLTTGGPLPLLRSPLLDSVPGIWYAFTTRAGGVSYGNFATLNLSATVGDDLGAVRENRRRLANLAGVDPRSIRLQTQVHGADVVRVTGELPAEPITGDAFVTDRCGVPLLIGVADCAPVILAAEDGTVVAVAHAGWRGAAAGVVRATAGVLKDGYGIPSDRLRAAIGPAIGPCCFQVEVEVARLFDPSHVLDGSTGGPHVDLPRALAADLVAAGLRPEHIDRTSLCTRCRQDLFFSHRGSGGCTGRMVAMILRR